MSPVSMQQFAQTLRFQDIPDSVRGVLTRSMLDTVGVAASGSTCELSRIARKVAPVLFGASADSSARMLMDGRRVSAAGAAMAGAFTVDAVDAHDGATPCKGHAGSAVFPALMAVADALLSGVTSSGTPPSGVTSFGASGFRLTGADFLTHLAVAYEVSYRAALVQHATCADYHTSGAWTAVGVAAACARMLGGTAGHIRHAAGIGEYHGPRSQMMRCIDHPSMLRDGVGWGAPSGVSAAYLALAGFTGAPALTCGDTTGGDATGGETAAFWDDLGTNWRIAELTHYKAYPCCRWAHPAIDAVKHLRTVHEIDHRRIARIKIRTFHNATRLAGHEPETADDFAYAIAFPVALMAVRGRIGVGELTEATLWDEAVLRVSRITELTDDPEITARSVARRYAQVDIVMSDGRVFSDDMRSPRGDADDPLSDGEIADKYHMFADPVMGRARAEEVKNLSLNLCELNARDFKRLLDLSLAAC